MHIPRAKNNLNLKRLAGNVVLVSIAVLAANNWFHTVNEMKRDYSAVPDWDYWEVVGHLSQYRAHNVGVLWQQHNEHRIIFPEIVFAADMLLCHGRQLLPLAVSLLAYLFTWLLFGWVILHDLDSPKLVRWAAFALAGYIIGWPGSSAVLSSPFLLQWTLVQLAAASALFCLARAKETARILYFAGAICAAVVATFSSANGLVLWPVLIVSGWILQIGAKRLAALGIAAALAISAFFYGYHSLHSLNFANFIHHPVYFLGFLASYVSMPIGALSLARGNSSRRGFPGVAYPVRHCGVAYRAISR